MKSKKTSKPFKTHFFVCVNMQNHNFTLHIEKCDIKAKTTFCCKTISISFYVLHCWVFIIFRIPP